LNKDLLPIIDYLSSAAIDPFPRYILKKEILRETPAVADIEAVHLSKWYRQLADEQWEDGSWGRFHTQDSKAPTKQIFVTTESALCRAYELSLTKDDPMIAKCIKLMERYVRGEETWTDWVEKHKDGGRGHLFARPYGSAARINMFDPENPSIQPLNNNLTAALEITSTINFFCDNIWEKDTDEYLIALIAAPSMYSALLLQNSNCMSDALQKQYLSFLWYKKDGIYYVSSVPVFVN